MGLNPGRSNQRPAISWREQVNFQWDDDEVHFVQDRHAELDFYNASSLKQQSAGRHVAPLGHIILIPSQPVWIGVKQQSHTHLNILTVMLYFKAIPINVSVFVMMCFT
jgi:hypothetical protein